VALMKEYADKLMPDVADVWHADETVLNVNGQYQWMWNLMDRETRFLIASRLTQTRREHDATNLFLEGQRISGVVPNVLVTDGLGSYAPAFDQTFAKKHTRHIRKARFIDKANNNISNAYTGQSRKEPRLCGDSTIPNPRTM